MEPPSLLEQNKQPLNDLQQQYANQQLTSEIPNCTHKPLVVVWFSHKNTVN